MTAKKKEDNGAGGRGKSFKVFGAIVLIVAIGLVVVWLKVVRGGQTDVTQLATFEAKQGQLVISVLESGTIKAREQVIIKNEVEGRTSIISLIPEGTHVKKGDLLVELDASTMDDERINQEIIVQNAEAAYINATETLAVVKNQAESDIDVAKLTLEFAKQDLGQYKEGLYPNELAVAKNEITLAEEELTRARETLQWSQKLYEEKYISQTELQGDQLTESRASVKLEVAKNNLKLLETFTYQRNIAQLESDLRQATMALERTQRKARADVIQAEAALTAKKQEFDRQQAKLTKLKDQIKKATVYAPNDGMVIYATTARRGGWRDNREPLDEGVEVFERQELIYLPTATSSMAEVDIHEASLEKVHVGLPAAITVDALPGKKFYGTVGKIAPLPDPQSMWMNPDLKVYNSEVYLEGDDPSLRTGMSCKVEIIVAQYLDAVYVPVQSVIRVDQQPTVYVVKDGVPEKRVVEIGLDNNRMVHVTSGLSVGEEVLLAPPLKAATIEAGAAGTSDGSTPDAVQVRINQNLEEARRAPFRSPDGSSEEAGKRPEDRMGEDRQGMPQPSGRDGKPGGGARPERNAGPGSGAEQSRPRPERNQ